MMEGTGGGDFDSCGFFGFKRSESEFHGGEFKMVRMTVYVLIIWSRWIGQINCFTIC